MSTNTSSLPPHIQSLLKQKKHTDPLDAQFKHQYEMLYSFFKSVKSGFSFKRVENLKDVLWGIGHSLGEIYYAFPLEQLEKPITFKEIVSLEEGYINRLVLSYENQKANKIFEAIDHEYENSIFTCHIGGHDSRDSSKQAQEPTENKEFNKEEVRAEIKKEEVDPYTIPFTSPKQVAKLMIHQTRAVHALVQKVYIEKKRCVLLESPVGSGKTFIYGAFLRYLDDRKFIEENQCMSPWPFCIVTKASVVEQTKRVMRDQFGLDMNYKCHVINVEQLRARFGEYLLDEKTTVRQGIEETEWVWKPMTHPIVLIIDESQFAKNEDSTQSEIIQALSNLPADRRIHIICSSATPFTRIVEARYFAVNTHMEIK